MITSVFSAPGSYSANSFHLVKNSIKSMLQLEMCIFAKLRCPKMRQLRSSTRLEARWNNCEQPSFMLAYVLPSPPSLHKYIESDQRKH